MATTHGSFSLFVFVAKCLKIADNLSNQYIGSVEVLVSGTVFSDVD